MNRVRPGRRFVRAAVLPLLITLAGCQYIDQYFRDAKNEPPRSMPTPPAMEPALHEIPLAKVTVDKPEAPPPKPEAPQQRMRTASAKPPSTPPARPPVAPAKKPTPPPAAAKEEIPTVAPGELVGSDFAGVLQVLRKPDTVQSSALSVVWTYSQAACTVQLFFYPDIQTKVFRLLKYDLKSDAGEKTADRSACLHDIMAVRNDEPAIP
jgi:hypothetical protein